MRWTRSGGYGTRATRRGGAGTSTSRSYRTLATELENVIDRHLVANGEKGVVKAFRRAREMIAKTYSVERAMNKATGVATAERDEWGVQIGVAQ